MYRISLQTFCLGLVCLFVCKKGSAQQHERKLHLRDLVEAVYAFTPSLATDSVAITISRARQNEVNANRLPSLGVSYQANLGTNNNLPGGYFSYNMVPSNSRVRDEGASNTIMTTLGAAAFSWEFYRFGAWEAEREVAGKDVEVAKARLNVSRYDLLAYTLNSYLELIRLEQLLSIQAQNIERTTEIRRSILALAQSGIIAGVDTSIAEAEISKSRLNHLELSNQVYQVKLQLSAMSGMPPSDILVDTSFHRKLFRELNKPAAETDVYLDHPLMQWMQARYQSQLMREELVKKSFYPSLFLQGAVWGRGASVSSYDEFRPLVKGAVFERANYLVGVGITYDLFNTKRKSLQINTSRASSEAALKELEQRRWELSLNIIRADAEINTAKARLEEIPHQLSAANAAFRQKLALYKNGLTNIVDLNAALSMLYRAETDYTNANFLFSKAVLEKALNENQVESLLNSLP